MDSTKKILITGIPGTGKTTIGNYLEANCDFDHIDLESKKGKRLLRNLQQLVKALSNLDKNTVVTWGFPPSQNGVDLVRAIKKEMGFELFWFEGNRQAARKVFNERGTVREELLDKQLKGIQQFEVVEKIDPIVYSPFKANGEFKPKEEIVEEIL